MALDLSLNSILYLIGEATVIILASAFIIAFVLVIISLYSIKKGKLYFPRILKAGLALLEGLMQAMFRLLGLEDKDMLAFFVKLQNAMNKSAFERIPVSERAIFMPQCLRSSKCPANLTPEGLKCVACGKCTVGEARILLEKMGYRVFIVPGSSFIKRMVKKYRPKADSRRRVPYRSERGNRHGRQDRARRYGGRYRKRGVRRDAGRLGGCV